MKKNTILLAFSLFSVYHNSQTIANRSISEIINYDIKTKSNDNIEGSPYLSNDFSVSKINNISNSVETRYNCYTDEIEFKLNGTIYILPKNENLYNNIHQNNGTYLRLIKGHYYIAHTDLNKINLLSLEKTIIETNESIVKNGYTKEEKPNYTREKTTYYLYDNENLILIDKKFESIEKAFNKNNISEYIKKNKPNTKRYHPIKVCLKYKKVS